MRNLLLVLRLHRALKLAHRAHRVPSPQLMPRLRLVPKLHRGQWLTHRARLIRNRQFTRNLLLIPRQHRVLSPRRVHRVRRVLLRKRVIREKGERQNGQFKVVRAEFSGSHHFLAMGNE